MMTAEAPAVSDVVVRSIGQVQAISLMAFKTAFGEVWQHVGARAMALALRIIKRHLAAEDVFSRLEDHGFLVWFDRMDGERNAAVLAACAREIRLKFMAEFGEEMSPYLSALVIGDSDAQTGPAPDERLLPSQAALDHLRDERHSAWVQARALLQSLRDSASVDIQMVTGRDRKARAMVMVDFAPALRQRLAAMPLFASEGAMDQEVELRRLDAAVRQLAGKRGGSVLVPISWCSLSAPECRRLVNERVTRLDVATRSRLVLSVGGVPPFKTAQHWTNFARPLEGLLGGVALMMALSEGDQVSTQAAVVNEWPLSMVVIDATAPASLAPDRYYDVTVAVRYRQIPVLVRMTKPADLRDWHELGATMFVGME